MGQDKTLEVIYRNYLWPEIEKEINNYVRSYHIYQRMKHPLYSRYSLLNPLKLAYALRQLISMDFIMNLSLSKGYSQIWIIIDNFTK
jgi:hypothetical protein